MNLFSYPINGELLQQKHWDQWIERFDSHSGCKLYAFYSDSGYRFQHAERKTIITSIETKVFRLSLDAIPASNMLSPVYTG